MQCGAELVSLCSNCQAKLPPQARFCVHCGQPARQAARTPDNGIAPLTGERRQATIILADIKGSTDLSERVDVETWVEIMNHVFQILGSAIYRYGGEIDQYRGDGLVAFFGAKVTHEDDPERAVLASLAMQEAVHQYSRQLAETEARELLLRVGVNTGEVIAATVGGGPGHYTEDTAMGRAIALAARLESAAEPGTVQVSENTYQLVAHSFEWQPLGQVTVKGFSQPQSVYRPLAHKPDTAKMRGIAGLECSLVGRQAEIDALCRVLERLQAGIGGIVTVVGEAGLGKSRLVTEVREMVAGGAPGGLRWVEGRCLSYASSTAYQLWLDMQRSVLDIVSGASATTVAEALQVRVQVLCSNCMDDVLPFLTQMMSLPLDTRAQDILRGLGADGLKAGTFRAIETLITCALQRGPLVIVCEDLHWADMTSLELLDRVLALTDRAPLLLICVLRPDVEHACWQIREKAAGEYRHHHTDIWLSPLSDAESRTLVENLLHVEGVPLSLQEDILGRAEGNPFYLEEILRSLMEDGVLLRDESSGRWTVVRPAKEIHLPATLHGVLMARIDRLDAECKRVLQLASVIGRIFDERVLATIVEAGTRQNLQQHLVTLLRTQMIRQRTRLPEPVYIFKHHLTQEAAYSGLLNRERRLYHRQVAETLEQLYADRIPEHIELLAHHWEYAEEFERAISYLIQAGDRARRLGASGEAVSFFRSAQEKAETLAPAQGIDDLRLIHERLGDIYMENLSRYGRALDHYRSFLALAATEQDLARGERKVGSVHLLRGEVEEAQDCFDRALDRLEALPPLAEASRIHYCLASLSFMRHELDEATRHAQTSLQIAQQVDDRRGMADAFRTMGGISNARGEPALRQQYDARSLELYRELGDWMRIAQACNNLGGSYQWSGQMDRALALYQEGLQIAQRIGDTRDEALLLTTTAEVYLDQGRWALAIEHLERALFLAQESGTVSRQVEAHWLLGAANERVGHLDEAWQHLEAAEAQSRGTSHWRFAPRIYLDLARLCATEGTADRARLYIEQAIQAAGPAPADLFLGHLLGCRGYLYACTGDWDAAIEHLEKSLDYFERAELIAQVGVTRLELGRAYVRRGRAGDHGGARKHLQAALSTLSQIGARRYVAMAKAQLELLDAA
jgi:class 3 adenylate cyclase/tetratricopeptide (TPR) repeat protein